MRTDPLAHSCPVCLAEPGQRCENQITGQEQPPHGMRGLVVRCVSCQGMGWRPEGYETKEEGSGA